MATMENSLAQQKIGQEKVTHRWYIVHAHSGHENKVARAIEERAQQKGIAEAFEQVIVPVEKVLEVKRGKKVESERKIFPGYVLVRMDLSDQSLEVVKNIPRVTGFLGGKAGAPSPISDAEASRILKQVEEGQEAPRQAMVFDIGDSVRIIDGAFESFVGVIEEIDEEKEKLKVAVSIFGRSTPVELDFSQVEES